MPTKEQAYTIVAELTERFEQTRLDFINPFFEALGWDMNNKAGAWETYREVIHEDKLRVGSVTTAPDYSPLLAQASACAAHKKKFEKCTGFFRD